MIFLPMQWILFNRFGQNLWTKLKIAKRKLEFITVCGFKKPQNSRFLSAIFR
jgi:hypothetical protein